MNVSKAGQAIPLKWRLTDALGRPITDVTSVAVQAYDMTCALGHHPRHDRGVRGGTSGLQNLGDGVLSVQLEDTEHLRRIAVRRSRLTFGAGGLGYTEKPSAFFTFKK